MMPSNDQEQWRELALDWVRDRGHDRFLAFLRANEAVPYRDLALMIRPGELALIQLIRLGRADLRNPDEHEYFLRTSLIRNLHQHTPSGFRAHGDWPLNLALASWGGAMGDETEGRCRCIIRAIKRLGGISDDWLPAGPDDPELARIFASCTQRAACERG